MGDTLLQVIGALALAAFTAWMGYYFGKRQSREQSAEATAQKARELARDWQAQVTDLRSRLEQLVAKNAAFERSRHSSNARPHADRVSNEIEAMLAEHDRARIQCATTLRKVRDCCAEADVATQAIDEATRAVETLRHIPFRWDMRDDIRAANGVAAALANEHVPKVLRAASADRCQLAILRRPADGP